MNNYSNHHRNGTKVLFIDGISVPLIAYDSSPAVKQVFDQTIYAHAKETGSIEIHKSCSLVPPIAKISSGQPFVVTNADRGEHRLSVKEQVFVLPPGTHIQIASLSAIGIYGVSCDESLVGFIWIAPTQP